MARMKKAPTKHNADQPAASPAKERKRRWRPGVVAMRQMRKQQKSTSLIIPRTHIKRMVRDIAGELCGAEGPYQFKTEAIDAIHVASEDAIHEFMTRYAAHLYASKADMLKLVRTAMFEPHVFKQPDAGNRGAGRDAERWEASDDEATEAGFPAAECKQEEAEAM